MKSPARRGFSVSGDPVPDHRPHRLRFEPLAIFVAAVAFVLASAWAWWGPMVGDEWVHYPQILRFAQGEFSVDRDLLTTIPGYHALIAVFVAATSADSLGAARLFNGIVAISAVVAFHAARRATGHDREPLAIAQFAVLPVVFPFFFLAYTDVLSLALLLGACAATSTRRHVVAGMLLLVSLGVRQNNVVWIGFLGVLAAAIEGHLPRPRGLSAAARVLAPYAAGVVAFLAFWCINGSISLSTAQATAHPDLSVHAGNIVFTLAIAGALLPLQVARGLVRAMALLRCRPWLVLIPLVLAGTFALGFSVDHPYNLIDPRWSYRNQLLQAAQTSTAIKAALVGLAVAAACGLATARLRPPAAGWFLPFALVSLASSWLIETRYAIVPLALWLVFRERDRPAVEAVTFVYWLAASALLFFGVMYGRPFL